MKRIDGTNGQLKPMKNQQMIEEEVEKINALNSSTKLRERVLQPGLREEWHEHPETKEVIVVHTRTVPDGDCVSFESEIMNVYSYKKDFANCIRALEYTYRRLEEIGEQMKNG